MNLLKALATISGATFISRVLGFVRDAMIARIFGAGFATDAFFIAFKLPNLLRRIFAEGAFSQAFVPLLAEYKKLGNEDYIRYQFLSYISGTLAIVLLIITIGGIIIAPWIIYLSAPGFANDPLQFELAIRLLRITFPYIFFISLASFVAGILNTYNQFLIPAFTPVLLNLSFIGASLFLTSYFSPPILTLAWAVTVGGILQLVFQLPALARIKMLCRPRFSWHNSAAWRVIKKMGPAIFGVSVAQISLIINAALASFLAPGSVSWMYYADRLMEFPSGMLGAALGTVLLPSLSLSHNCTNSTAYSHLLDWGIRLSVLLVLPAALGIAIIAEPLIIVLFQYGQFTLFDALMTKQALIAYSIGLPGIILIKVLAPAFYARQDVKTPVKIASISIIFTQLLNLLLIQYLQHVGLALGISLGAFINATLLFYILLKRRLFIPQPGWKGFLIKVIIAAIIMASALRLVMMFLPIPVSASFGARCSRLLPLVFIGAATYFGTLVLLGFRLRHFIHRAIT